MSATENQSSSLKNKLNIEWLTTPETNKNSKQLTIRITCGILFIILSIVSFLRVPYFGVFLDAVIFDLILFGTAKYIFYFFFILIGICFLVYKKNYWRLLISKRFILFMFLIMFTFALVFAIVNYFLLWTPSTTLNTFFQTFFQNWKNSTWTITAWFWVAPVFINGGILWTILIALFAGIPILTFFVLLLLFFLLIAFIICIKLRVKKIEKIRKKWIVWLGGFYKKANNEPNNNQNKQSIHTDEIQFSSNFTSSLQTNNELDSEVIFPNNKTLNSSFELNNFSNGTQFNYDGISNNEIFSVQLLSKKTISFYDEIIGTSENNYEKNYQLAESSMNNLSELFLKLSIFVKPIKFGVGPNLISLEWDFLNKENVSKLTQNKHNVEKALNVNSFEVFVKNETNVYFQFPVPYPNKIHFSFLNQHIDAYHNKLTCAIGIDENNKNLLINLSDYQTIFLIGTIGSGKGMLISNMLLSLITHYSTTDLMLAIIDTHSCHLSKFEGEPHLVHSIPNNTSDAFILFDKILAELKYRINLIKSHQVDNIDEYNDLKLSKDKIKPLVIVVNDIQSLLEQNKEYVFKFINTISSYTKTLNCYMILIANELSDELTKIKFNLGFGFKLVNKINNNLPLYTNYLSRLYGNGDFVMFDTLINPTQISRGQLCFISSKDVTKIIDNLKKQVASR